MAAEYERHVKFVAERLGVEPRSHIPLYLLTAGPAACEGNPACTTPDGVVFSQPRASYHELVHGIACQLRTDSVPALSEGLAVMFEPEALTPRDSQLPLLDLLGQAYPLASEYYRNAGHFSRWLYERQGGIAFAELYSQVEREEDVVDLGLINQAFVSIYSTDLEGMDTEYDETAPSTWAPFRQCADVEFLEPEEEGEWRWSAVLDCDREDTLGPYERKDPFVADPAHLMYQSFTFMVPVGGGYVVEFEGAKQVEFERCAEGHVDDQADAAAVFDWAVALWETSNVTLTPGLWRADVLDYNSSPGAVEVWIRPE